MAVRLLKKITFLPINLHLVELSLRTYPENAYYEDINRITIEIAYHIHTFQG